jgi:hypothetical protein
MPSLGLSGLCGFFLGSCVVLGLGDLPASAEGPTGSAENPCGAPAVSVPSRPTVTSATDTTKCGVVELEYGLERQWPGGGANRDDLTGGLRFGLTPNLDFHWWSSDFVHLMNESGNRTGFGDTWLGLRYRFLKETKRRPSLGVFYAAKVASASAALGGTGQVDQTISFLASKDVHRVHFDFNVIPLFAGQQGAPGFDHSTGFALSAAIPLSKRWGLVGEGYGYTPLNATTHAFASTMFGCTYVLNPRLVLDSGFDVGVTSDAPRERVYVGVTYAISNLYRDLRSAR